MFCLKNEVRENWFVAEAKQSYPCITGSYKALKRRIEKQLRKARSDARNSRNYGYPRLGIVFLCPYSAGEPPEMGTVRKWVRNLIDAAKENKASLAFNFPMVAHDLPDLDRSNKKKYYYPGEALLIRRPRRPNRK
jgi:hypothetical protein